MEPQETSEGRIEIAAPQRNAITFETPDGVWDDLESYLFTGFLTTHAEIQGVQMVFKTLNPNELRNISYMRTYASQSTEYKNQFRSLFIAHSVFMVNGQNFLYKRSDNIDRLVKIINKLGSAVQDRIVVNLSALNAKAQRIHGIVEAYSFEPRSRFRWAASKDTILNSVNLTGLPGTEELGMNVCQTTWVALNRIQDLREDIERNWANSKFIGGCFVGKGMRSIEEKDKNRLQEEEQQRQEKRSKALREYLNRGGEKEDTIKEMFLMPDGRRVEVASRYKASTADELAKELSAALNEEKDEHDLAVEAHMKKLNERNSEIAREKLFMQSNANPMIMQDSGITVLGKHEVEERLRRMRESILTSNKGMTPESALPNPE